MLTDYLIYIFTISKISTFIKNDVNIPYLSNLFQITKNIAKIILSYCASLMIQLTAHCIRAIMVVLIVSNS